MKLTKRTVDALAPSEAVKDKIYWDEETPRFGVRVSLGRKKAYLLQYRNLQGSLRKLTIGTHGTWTPETAREEAKRLLRIIDCGGDPLEQKKGRREALTVEQLCRSYFADCERGLVHGRGGKPKKESTVATDRGRIEQHIIPLMGKRLVQDITTADVKAFLNAVALGKTAKTVKTDKLRRKAVVTGGRGTARRTVGLLGGIFSYAVEHGHAASNPVRGVKRGADGKREFRRSAEEYRAFGRALEAAEQSGEHWQSVAIARLLALTGCRHGEIVQLKKTELDVRGRCLRLADNKIGGAVIPLGEPALQTFAGALEQSHPDSPFVFSGVRKPERCFGDFANAWGRIVGKDFTPHGLRHAFASACDELDMGELTIAALLGHSAAKQGSVTRGYIHKVDAVLLAAADKASRYIWRAMAGETAEVVSLQRGANA
jgi:integrase